MINITEIEESIIVADNSTLKAVAKGDVVVNINVNGVTENVIIHNVL